MPKYRYTALSADGTPVKGVQEALSLGLANVAISERDLQPVHVREKKSIWQFEITRKKVPRKDLMHFSRQLGAFLRAGIPVLDALEALLEETTNKLFGKILREMITALQSGETFGEAASAHPEAFPDFYLGILRSAEMTGNLDTVLDQLSEYIERDVEARRKIVSALVYPAMVMGMSVVTVVVLTAFVLPRFETFFTSFNAKLPLATRLLLDVTHFVSTYWYVIVVPVVAVVVVVILGQRTIRGKAVRDSVLLRMPVLGGVIRFAVIERFCRILTSMVDAGVPLPDALLVITEGTDNDVFRRGLLAAREAMLRGEGLAGPLAETGLFPAAARQMFRVGEETGTLDQQLQIAARFFDRELDYKIKRFTALFEPAVIVMMGLIVGFVAIALVSAMYGIYNQVNVT
jgi:type IV pilus assembly protein PilC